MANSITTVKSTLKALLQIFLRIFRVPWSEWPPSPAAIRKIAPLAFLVLFVPKFALEIRRLFSFVPPDSKQIATSTRKFITASRKACSVLLRANDSLAGTVGDIQKLDAGNATTSVNEALIDISTLQSNLHRFNDVIGRLTPLKSPEFLFEVPRSGFDMLVAESQAKKKAGTIIPSTSGADSPLPTVAELTTPRSTSSTGSANHSSDTVRMDENQPAMAPEDYDDEEENGSLLSDEDIGDDSEDGIREREIHSRHSAILALLGSLRAAYNELVDAHLEQDTQIKVYKIKVDETKLNQAATLAHLMLAHATVLSFHLFLETVMLTVEGKLEKFKDGQELRTVWSGLSFYLCELRWTVPYADMKRDPNVWASPQHRVSSFSPMKQRATAEMWVLLRGSLDLFEAMRLQKDEVLRQLKMGDYRKVFRFTKLILGRPRNWMLTMLSWILTIFTSAVSSTSFHYRNLLISVVKTSVSPGDGSFDYEASVGAAIDAVGTTATAKTSTAARFLRRILLGHSRTESSGGAVPVSLALGKRLAEVLFAVFFMEILQVLLRDLTEKCKAMGIAAIEDRLAKSMIRAVLSQDLEDAQKAEKPNQAGGSRRHSNFTPRQLVRDICSEEHGLVGGILDIPLHVLSASSTALTTGLLLWNKNKVLLMALLGMSAVTYNLKTFVARTRDWLGARLGVHVEDKYDLSAAELDLLDGVDNFKDMRVNGNELYHLEQYQISKEHTQRARDRADTLVSLFDPLENIVKQFPMLCSYWLGGWLVLNNALEAGDLANFLETTRQLIHDFRESHVHVMELVKLEGPNIRRITAIVDLFDQKPRIGINKGEGLKTLADGSIEFRNVSFVRPDWPLNQQGLSFTIPSGAFVAVCGRNGAGKSTLFGLLLRLYEANSGDIFVGGKNIKDVNPVDLRSRIAIAIQSPGMKMDCIRANCIYGSEKLFEETPDPEYMDRKIYEALVKLNSWSMFSDPNTFPEGIDSYKWELSGGQKRVVGLVRAIIRESKILLLDEPTNDLDPDRQEAVKENIFRKRGSQTVMCVTHDISLIREADMIIFLSKDPITGITTISEQGTYDELKENGGTFQKWHAYKTNATVVVDTGTPTADPLHADDEAIPRPVPLARSHAGQEQQRDTDSALLRPVPIVRVSSTGRATQPPRVAGRHSEDLDDQTHDSVVAPYESDLEE